MTIDEIEFVLNSIKIVLEHIEKGYYPEQFKTHEKCLKEVMGIARKYQKIVDIVSINDEEFKQCGLKELKEILEVIADGNDE